MIVLGIDEAGYGPLLGPLVVSGVAFRAPPAVGEASVPDFWNLLSASITPNASRRDVRLTIGDSKKLYNPRIGIEALERAALVMLLAGGKRPSSMRELVGDIGWEPPKLDSYPWYQGFDLDLPAACDAQRVALQANAVRRDLQEAGVSPPRMLCNVILEGEFNQKVCQTHNKAVVLAEAALGIAARAVAGRGRQKLWITIDRHGGRKHYREVLMTYFTPRAFRIIEESDERSAYEVTDDRGPWTIEFVVGGEGKSMPVALASIYSKYLRELLMMGLNRYFRGRVTDLKPTAGYYMDAKRFLGDIESVIATGGLDRAMLVRAR